MRQIDFAAIARRLGPTHIRNPSLPRDTRSRTIPIPRPIVLARLDLFSRPFISCRLSLRSRTCRSRCSKSIAQLLSDANALCELLKLVGLEHRLDHFPSKLSGGERQRVAIARSLANGPSLLLADEPTGNLDSENAHSVLDLIIRLQQEQGRTMVLVTHDATIAERAGRILRMKDGRIVSDQSSSSALRRQAMTFFTVVIRGLLRRPLRTGFTLAGISIGIAAVVALVGMSRGFRERLAARTEGAGNRHRRQ